MEEEIINLELEKENIKNLLKSGDSFKNIAKLYNVSTTKLWRFVKDNNLKDNFKPFKKRSRWTEDEINLIKSYLDNNKSIRDIVEALKEKHSESSIKTLIQKQKDNYGFDYKPTRHYPTEDEVESIKRLTSSGFSGATIAKKLNIGKTCVRNTIRRLGLVKANTLDGFFRNHINIYLTEEYLYDLYVIKNKTAREIAEIAKVSVDSVRRRIKKLNIQKPKTEKEPVPISKTKEHTINILTNYLGYEPSSDIISKPFKDIFKKEDIEKVYEDNDYNSKLSAQALKLSTSCFFNLLKYNNIPIHRKIQASDFSEEFYTNCIDSGMSYSDISEQIGLSPDTIRKYIGRKFPKLKTRGEYVSSGENMVASVLKLLNIKFKYNNLLYINNNKVYIDFSFTLNNKEYWIEYNGKQHYEFINYFFKTQERFEKQLERDSLVREYTKKNNITLIELKYSDFTTIAKIRDYLKSILLV